MATKKTGANDRNAQTRYQGQPRTATPKKVRAANATTSPLSDEDREYLNSSLGDARQKLGDQAGDTSETGVLEVLTRFGLSSERVQRLRSVMDNMSPADAIKEAQEYFADQIESARDYSRENKGKVIGGAAGVLVGASLLAMALTRAAGEDRSVLASVTDDLKRRATGARKSRTGAKRSTTARKSTTGARKSASSGTAAKKSGGTSRKSSSSRSTSSSTSRKSSGGTKKSGSRTSSASKSSPRKSGGSSTKSSSRSTKSASRSTTSRGGSKKSGGTSRGRKSSS